MSERVMALFICSVGVLIMTVTGTCTITMGGQLLIGTYKEGYGATQFVFPLVIILVVGGLPFGGGYAIFQAGRQRLKKSQMLKVPDENEK